MAKKNKKVRRKGYLIGPKTMAALPGGVNIYNCGDLEIEISTKVSAKGKFKCVIRGKEF